MSHTFYQQQWHAAMEELETLLDLELPAGSVTLDPVSGDPVPVKQTPIKFSDAFTHYAKLYIRYLGAYRKLEDAYDQMAHPQKRRDMRNALDVVTTRICQIKHEMAKCARDGIGTDYPNLEDMLLSHQLPLNALDVTVPRHYAEKHLETADTDKRAKLMTILKEYEGAAGTASSPATADDTEDGSTVPKTTREHAIRIIQRHERGRQGLVRVKALRDLQRDALRRAQSEAKQRTETKVADRATAAATRIQRVFRGFAARKRMVQVRDQEMVFLHMNPTACMKMNGSDVPRNLGIYEKGGFPIPFSDSKEACLYAATQNAELKHNDLRVNRKARQVENELHYVESLRDLEQQVKESEGPKMRDEMWQARYQWWIEQKEKTGKFPENFDDFYNPPAVEVEETESKGKSSKKGGKAPSRPASSKSGKAEEKKAAGGKDKDKDAKGKGKKGSDGGKKTVTNPMADNGGLTNMSLVAPVETLRCLRDVLKRYGDTWGQRDQAIDAANPKQQHEDELAKQKLRPLVKEALRTEVDEKLLSYLANLREQVEAQAQANKEKDSGSKKKGKKGKKEKSKDGAEKKEKKAKKKGSAKAKGSKGSKAKAKKCCDGEKLCADLTEEDMLIRLVQMNVVHRVKPQWPSVEQYVGDAEVLGAVYQQSGVPRDPSMAHVRQCVLEYGVFPLGSDAVKAQSPLVNAVLLYGPRSSGKTMLSRAIAKAANATWFDLSPGNIESRLQSKQECAKLIHMIFAVAKAYAPSVIYMDQADKFFPKTKKKDSSDPFARVGSFLMTHKEQLSREHRVLIVGNSRQPFDESVDTTALLDCFGSDNYGKLIYTPCPSYDTRLKLWKHFMDVRITEYTAQQSKPQAAGAAPSNPANPALKLADGAKSRRTQTRILSPAEIEMELAKEAERQREIDRQEESLLPDHHDPADAIWIRTPSVPLPLSALAHAKTMTAATLLARNPRLDASSLARLSEGYPAGSILHAIRATLTPHVLHKLCEDQHDKLSTTSFLDPLSKAPVCTQVELEAFRLFGLDATGEQKRLQWLQELKEAESAANQKGNKPGKKPAAKK